MGSFQSLMLPSSPSRLCFCFLGLASFKALLRPSDGPNKHSHPRMEKHSTGARGGVIAKQQGAVCGMSRLTGQSL